MPALEEPFRKDLVLTIKREVALRLFADGKISSGYGAQMLRERKIPLFAYGEGELDRELATLDRLTEDDKLHT